MFAECVVNISEGRDPLLMVAAAEAAGETLLDLHADPEHHRSVVTLGGPLEAVEESARAVVSVAVATIDLRSHVGIHPRLGAADVVPFVPAEAPGGGAGPLMETEAMGAARNRFADWAASALALPCFFYGPERSLPDVRRRAFRSLEPDVGPRRPHPTAGATAVGVRPPLVAYNLWITEVGGDRRPATARAPDVARSLAAELRGPAVRSLGLPTESGAQVSFNVIDPGAVSLADLYDAVAAGVEASGCAVRRAELVGLIPAAALDAVPHHRWPELDLAPDRTIEARLEDRWGPTARSD